MAAMDDAAALAAAGEVTGIGLGTSSTVEVTGGGYVRLTPTYAASATAGAVDITGTLQFSGPASTTATHLIFVTADQEYYRPLAASLTFNSDGRVDITSAEVTATVA